MIILRKFKKVFIAVLLVVAVFVNSITSFSDSVDPKLFNLDDSLGLVKNGVIQYIIVTGDSYAGIFCDFEDLKGCYLIEKAVAGHTVEENEEVMTEAASMPGNILIISIGVNDHYKETVPYVFEATMRRILNTALEHNKTVFMHTYAQYALSLIKPKKYKVSQYNDIIMRLAKEYPNTHFIDMSDLQGTEYILEDNIHYGKDFYDVLFARIIDKFKSIDF